MRGGERDTRCALINFYSGEGLGKSDDNVI